MGLWFFLSVAVLSNMAFKAYKMRVLGQQSRFEDGRINELMKEVKMLREDREKREQRLSQLEEAVFYGDFELKRQFSRLEKEMGEHKSAKA